MGYDRQYIENISYTVLVFTKESLEGLLEDFSHMPENIVYRDDEIAVVLKRLLPYVLTFVVLSVLNTVGLVLLLSRKIAYNFRRLVTLGFAKKALDGAYYRHIGGLGTLSILIVIGMTIVVLAWIGLNQNEMILLTAISLVEFAALVFTATLSRYRLWRK